MINHIANLTHKSWECELSQVLHGWLITEDNHQEYGVCQPKSGLDEDDLAKVLAWSWYHPSSCIYPRDANGTVAIALHQDHGHQDHGHRDPVGDLGSYILDDR